MAHKAHEWASTMAKALKSFARRMSRRNPIGACCVCSASGGGASVLLNIAGVHLQVCDHLCAYTLGGLTTVAIRARRSVVEKGSPKAEAKPRKRRGVTRRATRDG